MITKTPAERVPVGKYVGTYFLKHLAVAESAEGIDFKIHDGGLVDSSRVLTLSHAAAEALYNDLGRIL